MVTIRYGSPLERRRAGLARRRLPRSVTVTMVSLLTFALTAIQPAHAETAGKVSNIHTLPGQIQFLFSADSSLGAHLSPKSVQVFMGETPLKAYAQINSASSSSSVAGPRTAMLVLDLSGSMAGPRIAAARTAAIAYVNMLPADVRIGLVTFSDVARLAAAPTADRTAVLNALNSVTANGSTALYDAIALGLSSTNASDQAAQAKLLILSDGDDTASKQQNVSSITDALRAASKISADVVAFGADADQTILGQLASAGHGQLLSATDSNQLTSAFGQAAKSFTEQMLITATVPDELSGKKGTLSVSVTAGSQVVHATSAVTLPGAAATSAATTEVTEAQAGKPGIVTLPILAALLFCIFLALCLVALWGSVTSSTENNERIAEVEGYSLNAPPPAKEAPEEVGSAAQLVLGLMDHMLRKRGTKSSIAADLDRAGIKLRPQEWTLMRICTGAVLIATFLILSGNLFIGLLFGGLLGWLGTRFYLKFKMSRRCSAFADQLPDTLQLVASSLRSGFSLLQAFDGVVREGNAPASTEFARALSDGRLGIDIEDALEKVADRMRCQDLAWVVMAIRISREVGGNLAEVLLTTVHTMRERAQVRRQVKALSAEGRLSGIILVGMPICIAGWLSISNRDYLKPLYTDPIGLAMLGGGIVSLCIGAWWMSKIVKIEV